MKTRKLYDIDAYATEFKAMVLSCEACGQTDSEEQQLYTVVLDQTMFFPEEGGQTPDKGILGDAEVVDVQIKDNVIFHYVTKYLKPNVEVYGKIDWQHRFFNWCRRWS